MLVVRLALAVVAWCLVCPLLCAVPLLLAPGPLGLFSSLALVPACSLGPGSAALSVGPLFSAGSVSFSPRPSAAWLSPLCAAAVHLVPMGCVVVALPPVPAGGALASVVTPFALLCSLLGALGLSWQGGCVAWLLSCCLVLVLLAWRSP